MIFGSRSVLLQLLVLPPIAFPSFSLAATTTGDQVSLNLSGNRKTQAWLIILYMGLSLHLKTNFLLSWFFFSQSCLLQPPLRTTSPKYSFGKPAADNNPSLDLSSCSSRTKVSGSLINISVLSLKQKDDESHESVMQWDLASMDYTNSYSFDISSP